MPNGQWAGSTRSTRLPTNWPALRRAIFARDGHTCWICGQPGADTIDHKVQGDDHSLTNLAPVHDRNPPHCHRFKSSSEGVAARTKRRRTPEPHPGLI